MNRIAHQGKEVIHSMHPVFVSRLKIFLCLAVVLFCLATNGACADEFAFDLAAFEKKPWHLSGYAELRPVLFGLDRDAALYRLRFFDRDEGGTTSETNARLQLEGSYERGPARLFARLNSDYRRSTFGETFQTTFYDGYLSLRPRPFLTLDAGKKSLRWGTGYAWNPAAFFDRPKDPDDPELNREGFIIATADFIRSFSGPLRTLALTPVLLPVRSGLNEDFGRADHLNLGGKVYLLFYDTDIDLTALVGGSRSNRYGVDFARHITSNFAVHGELAYIRSVPRPLVDADGNLHQKNASALSYLLGLRYLTHTETTWILEYYRNGSGYTRDEMRHFFGLVDAAFAEFGATGDVGALERAQSLGRQGFTRNNPMRDYLYLRVSHKEPFAILYLTPALTAIANLNDGSFSLAPEALYTPLTNLELRVKAIFPSGGRYSEFGERQNDYRLELRARYYF